jgi:4-hydroxy-4-methyl-2-oxoglutarate aldolase
MWGYGVRPRAATTAPAELIDRLRRCDPCDVSDAMHASGTMIGIAPVYQPIERVCGPAVTVSSPLGGVHVLRAAMDLCQPGDVLVVAARGVMSYAMFGGHISDAMRHRGLAAVVVDGCVRDPDEMRAAGLPVFARGLATMAATAEPPGEVNVPVACAGAVVNPGDLVLADPNGVVVVPPEAVEEVAAVAEQIAERHAGWADDIQAGRVPGLPTSLAYLEQAGCLFP